MSGFDKSEANTSEGLQRRLTVRDQVRDLVEKKAIRVTAGLEYEVVISLSEHFEAVRFRHIVFGEVGIAEGANPDEKVLDTYYAVRKKNLPMFAELDQVNPEIMVQVDALDADNAEDVSWQRDARCPQGGASPYTIYLKACKASGELVGVLRLTERSRFNGLIGEATYPYAETAAQLHIGEDRLKQHAWLIDRTCVAPDSRRKGVCTSLVSLAAEIAKMHGGVGLFSAINELNSPSLAAFGKLGWEARGTAGQRERQRLAPYFRRL